MKNKLIEIFKPGKHIAMDGTEINFSAADVEDIAQSYDPNLHEAPIVIGHPQNNSPAFGWIKELICTAGNKILQAMPAQLNADFVEAVNNGAYKKISASIYTKESPNNPTPGHYYLRHVGFLGAQPPAIKGLKAVEFAEDTQTVDFEIDFSERDLAYNDKGLARVLRNLKNFFIAKYSQEEADKAIPEWDIDNVSETASRIINTPDPVTKANFAEKPEAAKAIEPGGVTIFEPEPSAELEAEKKKSLALETELAALKTAKTQAANTDFCETQVKSGRLLPAQKNKVLQLLNAFSASTLDFAELEGKAPVESLKEIISAFPVQVNFSEVAPAEPDATIDFADGATWGKKAQLYIAEQSAKGIRVTASEAVEAVKSGK